MKEFCQYDSIEHAGNISLSHILSYKKQPSNQVSKDDILEVNEFLKEIMALQLKEESSDKEVTYESNKNCIANCNENEEGETDGHNDDIDVINLFNAKNV